MQMTQKILEAEGEGDPEQLDFFLKGNLALEKNARRKPHAWLPDQVGIILISTQGASFTPVSCLLFFCLISFRWAHTKVKPIMSMSVQSSFMLLVLLSCRACLCADSSVVVVL